MSLLLLSSACSTTAPKPVVQTKILEKTVPLQARPEPIKLAPITWRVVNKENLQQFLDSFTETPPVFFAISVQDYETLSINMAELSRYIKQQKAVIVYYETALSTQKESTNETK